MPVWRPTCPIFPTPRADWGNIMLVPRAEDSIGKLWVAGTPVQVYRLDGDQFPSVMGMYSHQPPSMWLRTKRTPRSLRAVIHEMLHHIDVARELKLGHDQIRSLSSGLDTTLRDRRNLGAHTKLYVGGHPYRVTSPHRGEARFALLQDIILKLNDAYRIQLTRSQISVIAADLKRTLTDPRNQHNNPLAFLLP